jgi:hypothetical protein
MWVKPAPGRTVRDPRSMAKLPDEGREVPDGDLFWVRRVRDGDVTVEAPPATHRRRAASDEARREA